MAFCRAICDKLLHHFYQIMILIPKKLALHFNSCLPAWKASLPAEEYIQTDDEVFSTTKLTHVVESRTKDHSGQGPRVSVTS